MPLFRSVPVCGHIFRLPGQRYNVHALPGPSSWPALHTHRYLRGLLDQWYARMLVHVRINRLSVLKTCYCFFSYKFWALYWNKEPLCALRMVIGIPVGRKQPTYSFSWNFYMNATAEQGPHLQGNLQCATKFTVPVAPQRSRTYTCSYSRGRARSSPRRGLLRMHHLLSAVFYSHWWTVMYQQSPDSKSLHMVSTFHNNTVWDIWRNALCQCV